MIRETKELLEKVKAENMASDKQCVKCVCYIAKYKDDYTLRHFGYGKVKIRPACSLAGTYGYVSHNPARLCRWYKELEDEI